MIRILTTLFREQKKNIVTNIIKYIRVTWKLNNKPIYKTDYKIHVVSLGSHNPIVGCQIASPGDLMHRHIMIIS